MSLQSLIRESYKEAVAFAKVDEELKRSLKTNERVPKFIDNLTRQVMALPMRMRTPYKVKEIVYSYTNVFLHNVDRMAKEKMVSDVAKEEMRKNSERDKLIRQAAETGIITEEMLT